MITHVSIHTGDGQGKAAAVLHPEKERAAGEHGRARRALRRYVHVRVCDCTRVCASAALCKVELRVRPVCARVAAPLSSTQRSQRLHEINRDHRIHVMMASARSLTHSAASARTSHPVPPGDGGREGSPPLPRHMRWSGDPAERVPTGDALPAVEVPGLAPRVRKVPVHGVRLASCSLSRSLVQQIATAMYSLAIARALQVEEARRDPQERRVSAGFLIERVDSQIPARVRPTSALATNTRLQAHLLSSAAFSSARWLTHAHTLHRSHLPTALTAAHVHTSRDSIRLLHLLCCTLFLSYSRDASYCLGLSASTASPDTALSSRGASRGASTTALSSPPSPVTLVRAPSSPSTLSLSLS